MWVVKFSCCLTMCFSLLSHRDDHIWLQASEDLTDKALAPQLSKCHAGLCPLCGFYSAPTSSGTALIHLSLRNVQHSSHVCIFFLKDQVIPEGQQLSGFVSLPLLKFKIMLHQKSDPPPHPRYHTTVHATRYACDTTWLCVRACCKLVSICQHGGVCRK